MYGSEFKDLSDSDAITDSTAHRRASAVVESSAQHNGTRYVVGVPWKCGSPRLPENVDVAGKRLSLLERRLIRDTEFGIEYFSILSSYERKGYISKVAERAASRRWFLPHHPVLNPHRPGKVRIVFDCAVKFNGESLNNL